MQIKILIDALFYPDFVRNGERFLGDPLTDGDVFLRDQIKNESLRVESLIDDFLQILVPNELEIVNDTDPLPFQIETEALFHQLIQTLIYLGFIDFQIENTLHLFGIQLISVMQLTDSIFIAGVWQAQDIHRAD